jgi:2-polyprenyl-6-methoxyphenol hydroxylase-like FAD-dependent oxidoreductase
MAGAGARVLVLERETEFTDRVRGEAMQPWGVAEARKLGVAEILSGCSRELRFFAQILNGQCTVRRDLPATTMAGEPIWGFYHPVAQERLLAHAAAVGAEVRRGVVVQHIAPDSSPTVRMVRAGAPAEDVAGRLVAICCGRNPGLRADMGFEIRRGTIPLLLAGVRVQDLPTAVEDSVAYVAANMSTGAMAALFRQPGDFARAYFGYHPQHCTRLQGERDLARFRELFAEAAGGAVPLGNAKPVGPLASFACVDVWVDHPYCDGVVLVGDAAASNDPSWGQGLSISFRDARVLSDELLDHTDWDAAAHRYASRHDADYGAVRKVTGWFYDLFQAVGPEADTRRARALPLIGQDPTRIPDTLFSGPDFPLQADSRARFLGEGDRALTARS